MEGCEKLTGRVVSSRNLSSLFNVNDINTHFQSINTDINYAEPALLEILPELHNVPVIHEISVFKALAHMKRTATGPDDLPFWLWKEHALELTPVITHILNVSLYYAVFRLERATEVLELTYLGKYFACVNAKYCYPGKHRSRQ